METAQRSLWTSLGWGGTWGRIKCAELCSATVCSSGLRVWPPTSLWHLSYWAGFPSAFQFAPTACYFARWHRGSERWASLSRSATSTSTVPGSRPTFLARGLRRYVKSSYISKCWRTQHGPRERSFPFQASSVCSCVKSGPVGRNKRRRGRCWRSLLALSTAGACAKSCTGLGFI